MAHASLLHALQISHDVHHLPACQHRLPPGEVITCDISENTKPKDRALSPPWLRIGSRPSIFQAMPARGKTHRRSAARSASGRAVPPTQHLGHRPRHQAQAGAGGRPRQFVLEQPARRGRHPAPRQAPRSSRASASTARLMTAPRSRIGDQIADGPAHPSSGCPPGPPQRPHRRRRSRTTCRTAHLAANGPSSGSRPSIWRTTRSSGNAPAADSAVRSRRPPPSEPGVIKRRPRARHRRGRRRRTGRRAPRPRAASCACACARTGKPQCQRPVSVCVPRIPRLLSLLRPQDCTSCRSPAFDPRQAPFVRRASGPPIVPPMRVILACVLLLVRSLPAAAP